MKKLVLLSMMLMMVFTVVLAGCGKDSSKEEAKTEDKGAATTDSGDKNADAGASDVVTPAGEFPIVKEKTTLKVLVRGNPLVENFATNEFTKWYEEKTNVHIEWEVVPEQSMQEKLNLVLASQDYPDVVLGMGVSPAQQMIYGEQGVFVPLNEMIEKYGVETKKVFAENPYIKDTITAPNGNIYDLPEINDCYHCSMSQKLWIYEPWLKKLNLSMPTTTEELYQVLKAFKEKDPNGNGKADEIPLSGSPKSWRSAVDAFLMNSFVYNSIFNKDNKHMFIKDGKIDVAYNKPEWKDGLTYLHKLYAEGLLSAESFTQDENQLKQIGEDPSGVRLGAVAGGFQGIWTEIGGKSNRWLEYKAVQPLKGPNGVQYAAYDPFGFTPGSFIITKAAKNPEVAFRWADGLYSEEATLRANYGRPDVEWRYAKEGELGINGKPAKWQQLVNFGNVQNVAWMQTGPSYRSNEFRLSNVRASDTDLEVILYDQTKKNYEPYLPSKDIVVPPLFFTNEQASEVADLAKTINDYVDEMLSRFVIGDADIEKEWDSYVSTLDNMNLTRYLEIYQTALDAKK